MSMSKTAALNAARKSVSSVYRLDSTSYVFYDFGGPKQTYSTEVQADSYRSAVLKRAYRVALNALEYMGVCVDDVDYEIARMLYDHYSDHSAKAMFDAALSAICHK